MGGFLSTAGDFVNRVGELEGYNTPTKQLRDKNADLLEHAILGIQSRTDLSPDEKTFQIGEARKQLQNLYEPHEGAQLFARLGKLFGKKDAGQAGTPGSVTQDSATTTPVSTPPGIFGDAPTPATTGTVPSTPTVNPKVTLRPGMTIDDVLAQGSPQGKPKAMGSPILLANGSWAQMTQMPDGSYQPQPLPGFTPASAAQQHIFDLKSLRDQGLISDDELSSAVKIGLGLEAKAGGKQGGYEPDVKEGIFYGVTGPDKEKYSVTDLAAGKGPKEALDLYKAHQTGSATKDQAQQDKEDRLLARQEKLAQIHADIQQKAKDYEDSKKIPAAIAGRVSQAEIIKEQVADLRTKLKDPDLQQYIGPVAGLAGGITRKFSKKVQDFYATQESLDSLLTILHGYRGGAQAHQIFHDSMGSLTIDPAAYSGTLDAIDKLAGNVIDEVKSEYPNANMFTAKELKEKGGKAAGVSSKQLTGKDLDKEIDKLFPPEKK